MPASRRLLLPDSGSGGRERSGERSDCAAMADNAAVTVYNGLDVSAYQGSIDWVSVKAAAVDFAMIRASSGRGNPEKQTDNLFHRNAYAASMAGIFIGAYHYSFATTADEAHREAECFLRVIDGYRFAYPVAIDIEDRDLLYLSNDRLNAVVEAWCDDLRADGYYPMIRADADTLSRRLTPETIGSNEIWVMHRHSSIPEVGYGLYQYSSGAVDGIKSRVNLDRAYKNYPELIGSGGLNGFGRPSAAKQAQAVPVSADRVKQVIDAFSELQSLLKLANVVLDTPGAKANPLPAVTPQPEKPPVQTGKKKTPFHFPHKKNDKHKRIP